MFIEKKPNLLNFILKQALTEENKSTFLHQYAKKKKQWKRIVVYLIQLFI